MKALAQKVLNWNRGKKTAIKIALMALFCVLICSIVVLIFNDYVNNHFTFQATITYEEVVEYAEEFNTKFNIWFVGFMALMFSINLVFFIVDTIKNDTVQWRRNLQKALNVLIILLGIGVGYWLISANFYQAAWRPYASFTNTFERRLKWLPYLVFALAGIFQMLWDMCWFSASNRKPLIQKLLYFEAKKEDAK